MPPKHASSGAKLQNGTLGGWLKTTPQCGGQQKRQRSDGETKDVNERQAQKKQKSDNGIVSPSELSESSAEAQSDPKQSEPSSSSTVSLSYRTGDIFSAPPNTLIIHACNCQGSWGGGIALAFKKNYPAAFSVYAKHCRAAGDSKSLLGTALLIPPAKNAAPKQQHFIGCLFTSNFYGKRRDSPIKILAATGPAMEDLLRQVRAWNTGSTHSGKVQQVRMCKINSGLFAVPWETTVEVLEGIEVGDENDGDDCAKEIEVVERDE